MGQRHQQRVPSSLHQHSTHSAGNDAPYTSMPRAPPGQKLTQQQKHDQINGWFIQRLQKILDQQANVRPQHDLYQMPPTSHQQYKGIHQQKNYPPQANSAN